MTSFSLFNEDNRGKHFRLLFILVSYSLVSALVLIIALVHPGINGYPKAMFPDMVQGTAYKPFVYRALVPFSIRVISDLTPSVIQSRLAELLAQRRILSYLRWEKEFLFQYLVAAILLFLSLLGFLLTLRQALKSFYDFPPWLTDLSPIFAVLALPLFFKYYTYLYDFPNLFLFTLGFLLIVTERTLLFYLIFVLATFNKETSLILIALYLLRNYEGLPRKTLIARLLLLGLIWAVIMAILRIAYSDNPGSWLEFHLLNHNLRLISDPWTLVYLFAFCTGWWLLVSYHWVSKSTFLRQSLLITLLPLVILAVFFGNLDELRIYYEALPFLFLFSLPTIAELYGINLVLKYQN